MVIENQDTELLKYCKDLNDWPESWEGMPEDVEPGRKILEVFKPFIRFMIRQGLSRKTIRNHIDNLWVLGGELIRQLNYHDSLRKSSVKSLIADSVCGDGGPYCAGFFSEMEHKSFDSTCRKLHKFIQDEK